MGDKPKILVLMVTHNGQTHINEQLKSVLAQRDVDVTLRIADDCSTDNTFRILETFASEYDNIQLSYSGEERGADRAYMDLVYAAEADEYDFVALAGQSDIWKPNKLFEASHHITANTSRPELYYANVRNIDERGKTLGYGCSEYKVCAENPSSLLLVPNWCLGSTALLNGALVKLLRAHPIYDFGRGYDAWIHAVALFCGGFVYCDLDHNYVRRRVLAVASRVKPCSEPPEAYTALATTLLREYRGDMLAQTVNLVEDVSRRQESFAARWRLSRLKGIVAPAGQSTRQLHRKILFNRC